MSIPFFSLGRRVHSITYTWSRNPSQDARDEPAWTTHARRVQPGQEIVINRDEDPEEGDLGLQQREKTLDSEIGEKLSPNISPADDESGGSSSSRTAGGEHLHGMEKAKREESEDESSNEAREDAEGRAVFESESEDEEENQDEARRTRQGRKTPPLAQYREGHHLVVERKTGEGEEVCD